MHKLKKKLYIYILTNYILKVNSRKNIIIHTCTSLKYHISASVCRDLSNIIQHRTINNFFLNSVHTKTSEIQMTAKQ